MSEVSLEEVERSLLEGEPSMAPGGYWKPKDCLPRWKVSEDVTFLKGSLRSTVEYTDGWVETNNKCRCFHSGHRELLYIFSM